MESALPEKRYVEDGKASQQQEELSTPMEGTTSQKKIVALFLMTRNEALNSLKFRLMFMIHREAAG